MAPPKASSTKAQLVRAAVVEPSPPMKTDRSPGSRSRKAKCKTAKATRHSPAGVDTLTATQAQAS